MRLSPNSLKGEKVKRVKIVPHKASVRVIGLAKAKFL